jgi:hypothetical protein
MDRADELLVRDPQIHELEMLAAKHLQGHRRQ